MSKKKKPHSLRHQLLLIIIGSILFSVVAITLINGLFFEHFYIRQKAEQLLSAKQELEHLDFESLMKPGDGVSVSKNANPASITDNDYSSDSDSTQNKDSRGGEEHSEQKKRLATQLPERLNILSSSNNLSWIVIRADNTASVHWGMNDNILQGKLFGYAYDIDTDKNQGTILEEKDNYVIQKARDHFAGMDYLECWGYIEPGYYYLIRTPLAAIHESVQISNRFYLFTGILMLLLGGSFVLIYTKRYTRPIEELTELSKRMSALDFEAQYTSHTDNEIDVLGESYNKMSAELKKTISELKSANIELQRDIDDKIKIDEMRKEFLDNVSHELKTPIAVIQGYAEGLKDGIVDDPESMDYYCDVIIDEATKMNNMVKKLLTLNHLESGKDAPQMERFNLIELIRGVLMKMQLMIEEKGAEVVFDDSAPIYVWADDFQTEEVVTNYMSNALNHLGGEKKIRITIVRENSRVRVTITNTGTPIPESELPKLWTKFYKVDKARSRDYGGSGIGLSIVKAIMNGMKQECGVHNEADGVSFWFTLEC